MPERAQLLFVSEGVHSHGALQTRLAAAVAERPELSGSYVSVPQPGRLTYPLVRRYGFLGSLDLQVLRWRLRWSVVARRLVRAATPRPDAVFVNTQACALALGREMRERPFVLSVDATARQFARLGYRGRRGRFSRTGELAVERLERRAYAGAAAVVAWTDWVAGSLRTDYGVPSDKIVTLNPGVDAARLGRAAGGAERGAGPLRVLFVGNDVERKGLPLAADAVAAIGDGATLDVVTGDAVRGAPHVRVHRDVEPGSDRLIELYASADVFALPSRADAAPWVALEAMAAGLPVVVSTVGALPELVGDAGLLVEPGDRDALTAALRRLADDPRLRAELAGAGRERVLAHYDSAVQIPRLLDLLGSLSQSRRG